MKNPLHLAVLALFALTVAACSDGDSAPPPAPPPPAPPPNSPQIAIDTGAVAGFQDDGADVFLGIPFAAPPVGALRFRPPEPPADFDGILIADSYSNECSQPASETDRSQPPIGDEDCLYLNVWTPSDRAPSDQLPVMVFVHGGGNVTGSTQSLVDFVLTTDGAGPIYDGAKLSSRGEVVVVTMNYRLGVLGFLAHESLIADGDTGSAGNYGLMDQLAALEWVQTNIEAFGGAPDRVMLFGQSGGARDVCAMIASPLAAGLFSRAATHSGPCSVQTLPTARANAEPLVEEVGCADAADIPACLRSVSAGELSNARANLPTGLGSFPIHPAVDNHVLDDRPINVIAEGRHNHVPFLIGSNSDEYAHRFSPIPDDEYESALETLVGPANVDDVLALYPLTDFDSAKDAVAAAIADRNIVCLASFYAATAAENQTDPVYRYFFTRTASTPQKQADGSYHGTELLFLFQHMDGERFSANDDDRAVTDAMLRYWTSFAANGDPNNAEDPFWEKYDPARDPYQIIDVAPSAETELKTDKCDYWLNGSTSDDDQPGNTIRIGAARDRPGDPEFLNEEDLVAYQSENDILIADLDPATGLFIPSEATLVDIGVEDLLVSFNGPEWGLDADGWSLFYTKDDGGVSQVWRAESDANDEITAAPLTNGDPHTGGLPTQNPERSDTLIVAINGVFEPFLGDIVWLRDSDPASENFVAPVADPRSKTNPDWLDEDSLLFYREPQGAAIEQLFTLDAETGTRRQITNDAGDKTKPYAWIAPDFGDTALALALVDDAAIGVYQDLGGAFWTRIATLDFPEGSNGVSMGSPEAFIAAGKSYITLSIQNNASSIPGEADSEIWIFDVNDDPETRITQRCDDEATDPTFRTDPESYLGEDQVFVYFNVLTGSEGQQLYRCATGIPTN